VNQWCFVLISVAIGNIFQERWFSKLLIYKQTFPTPNGPRLAPSRLEPRGSALGVRPGAPRIKESIPEEW
jgi:hypothetical protein